MTVVPAPVYANPALDRLNELAICLCSEIIAADVPDVCFCGVVPGDAAALDYLGDCSDLCGMAWVRLVTAYPSAQVATPDAQPRNCSALLGFDVELGIARCAPTMRENGEPPSQAEQSAAFELQMTDMMIMRRAVACCRDSNNWVLGGYTPFGPQGMAVGGVWTLSMQEV